MESKKGEVAELRQAIIQYTCNCDHAMSIGLSYALLRYRGTLSATSRLYRRSSPA